MANKCFCICSAISILALLSCPQQTTCQQRFKTEKDCCDYWDFYITRDQSKLKLFAQYQEDSIYIREDDESVICGIRCLLKYQGDRRKVGLNLAKFNPQCSTVFTVKGQKPKRTIEIAALSAIRSLFGSDDGLYTMTLLDSKGNPNSSKAIMKAYQYYREWFAEVQKVGLSRAREMKLDPLKGKDVQWDTGSGCSADGT
jgi:hypothetical protein